MTDQLDHQHRARLESLLFVGRDGDTPAWLKAQAHACKQRYQNFRLIPEFKAALNAFSDDTIKPFELFVVGEGKFGKSTIVNAMLGEERSKARGLPETRCFLRYVITDDPNPTVRLFLRIQPGQHDWLAPLAGRGKPVPELFEIYEHRVSGQDAREILDQDTRLMDLGNYESAVFEAERDHRRTSRSIFPSGVRIVDTPGLDQLFPGALLQQGRDSQGDDITQRFLNWLSETPRGKHLEWQFRRCDAVLWCINAKRIGSAATEASMKYFAAYSKKIVIALTNIDLVAKKPGDLERLMAAASKKYGTYATAIIPLDGQHALESVLTDDADGVEVSGLANLASTLTKVCVADGAKTRSVSRYLGLRKTESQFRLALSQLEHELNMLGQKYKADHEQTNAHSQKALERFVNWFRPVLEREQKEVISRIPSIELKDDRSSTLQKLRIDGMLATIRQEVEVRFQRTIIPDLMSHVDNIEPYRIPTFDAEGERYGDRCAISIEIPSPRLPYLALPLRVNLQNEVFERGRLWLKEKFLGFFSEQKKLEAQAERNYLTEQRRNYVFDEFNQEFHKAVADWSKDLRNQIADLYDPVFLEFQRVMERVENYEQEPIRDTQLRIGKALKQRAAKTALQERLLAGLRLKTSEMA